MLGSNTFAYTTLTLALAVSACAKQPTASDGRMSVAISVGPVQVRSAQTTYVDVIIPLLVTNASAEAAFFNPCAPILERSINGDWQTVFAQVCALDTSVRDVEIPAGTQRTVEFPVRAGLGFGAGYRWSPPLDGVYRLRTALRNGREMFPDSIGVTSSFRLPSQ